MSELGDNSADEILTTREAAAFLKVNPVVLARWANEGRIPAARISTRRWRFIKSELIDWLLERGAGRRKRGAKASSARGKGAKKAARQLPKVGRH